MIRTFDWRDLPLLHRLRDQGICLDSQLAFTRGPKPWLYLLKDVFVPWVNVVTLVSRQAGSEDQAVLGQFIHRDEMPHAQMSYIGPASAINEPSSQRLLDALSKSAGERGVRNLVAAVDEDSPAFESLRRAGFHIYTRQTIWCLEGERRADIPRMDRRWRMENGGDDAAIFSLYLSLVPGLVQQVEPPPGKSGHGLVHWREGELLGYLNVDYGPIGIWVQPYIHPAIEDLDELLAGYMAQMTDRRGRPLFFVERSYQSWISASLECNDFRRHSHQAVMVKRLAVGLKRRVFNQLPALEGTSPGMTAPFTGWMKAKSYQGLIKSKDE